MLVGCMADDATGATDLASQISGAMVQALGIERSARRIDHRQAAELSQVANANKASLICVECLPNGAKALANSCFDANRRGRNQRSPAV